MKKFLSLLMALTMLMACTACFGSAESASDPAAYDGSEVNITFYNTMGSNLTPVLDTYIEEFNKLYPNIHVSYTSVGGYDDVRDQISKEITVGGQPNIAYCYPDHVALYNLARAVQPLDAYIDSTATITRADGTTETFGLTQEQKDDFISAYYEEGRQFGDGKMYTLPMSKSTEVLYYNKTFFDANGLTPPTTWDEMWELGDKAAAEGTYLFTYPTTGYFDAFFYALMYAAGGPEFFNKATHYTEGIWDTPEAKTCFDIVAKLASYTNPITPAQANDQDFTQNQQLVLDNKALFMPNGTWIVGEMAEAPRADGFEWGMTALPAVKAGGDGYSYTWFEQAWIPAGAEHQDAAKQFVAYLYSDEACKLFAESGAIQPVLGIADSLEGDNKMFYSIYDNGAKAAMGNFAAFSAIPGVEVRTVFFDPVNSLVSGSMTEQQWIDGIKSASDQMRANIIE